MLHSEQAQNREFSAPGQPTTSDATGGAPQAGQTPSPTATRRCGLEPRRLSREVNLQRRRDEQMIGQRFHRNGIGQDGAHHGVAHHRVGTVGAQQRRVRRLRHVDVARQREQAIKRRIERGIGRETPAIERRHAEFACPFARVGSRHVGRGEPVLHAVLDVAERSEEAQIGRQRVAFGQRPEAIASRGEQRLWIGKTDKRRLGDFPDLDRIVPRRACATHCSRTLRVTWIGERHQPGSGRPLPISVNSCR